MLTETTDDAPKPLPIWMSIPIILLCLLGGGWIIHWYVMTDPISHEAKLLGDAPAQTAWQGGSRQQVPGGQGNHNHPGFQRKAVNLDQANGTLLIRTSKVKATLTVSNQKADLHNVSYINYGFLPEDAHQSMLKAQSLYQDQKRTEALKLDVHQVGKLRALSGSLPMVLSIADRKLFLDATDGYIADANNRNALEPKLLVLLDDIADRSMDATKQEAIDRAAEINKIVTPGMWKQDAAGK